MVLTFTCSFSVAGAGRAEVRTMLIGALGCNLAWAIIDAVFYLMGSFNEFGQGILKLRALREARNPTQANQIITNSLSLVVASVLTPAELDSMRVRLNQVPELPAHPLLQKQEWVGAFGVFLVVIVATLSVVLPFTLIDDARRAMRVSNVLAVGMLFLTGYAFGRSAGHRPLATGIAMVLLGEGW